MDRSGHMNITIITVLMLFLLIVSGCTGSGDQSGLRKAGILFSEQFGNGLDRWSVEGKGKAVIRGGRLLMYEHEGSAGLLVWTRQDFSGDFQVEYDTEIANNYGISLLYICASGTSGADIIRDLPERTGAFEEYTQGRIRSYHFSYHRFFPTGEHNPGVNIRKNPGFHQVAHHEPDPCLDPGTYHITLRKEGARLRFWVNDSLIHDWKDHGEYGPVLRSGKIGLRSRGKPGVYKVYYDNFTVYRLP